MPFTRRSSRACDDRPLTTTTSPVGCSGSRSGRRVADRTDHFSRGSPSTSGGLSNATRSALALDRLQAGRLLGLLTERQRAMVIAQYYLGLDQAEIGRLFNVRRGTVAATLAQALQRMRRGGQHAS